MPLPIADVHRCVVSLCQYTPLSITVYTHLANTFSTLLDVCKYLIQTRWTPITLISRITYLHRVTTGIVPDRTECERIARRHFTRLTSAARYVHNILFPPKKERIHICIIHNPLLDSIVRITQSILNECGLQSSNIPVSTPDPRSPVRSTPIVIDYQAHPATWYLFIGHVQCTTYPSHYIVWQVEQQTSKHMSRDYIQTLANATFVWHMAPFSLNVVNGIDNPPDIKSSWVVPLPFKPYQPFKTPPTHPVKYQNDGHILFYGAINERRQTILNHLKATYGEKMAIKCVSGQELFNEISNAAVVVNVHYYENASLELAGFNEVFQYSVPIVSEVGVESDIYSRSYYEDPAMVTYIPLIQDDLSNINELYDAIRNVMQKSVPVPAPSLQRIEQFSKANLQRALIPLHLQTIPYEIDLQHTIKYCLHLPETPHRIEAFCKQPNAPQLHTYRIIAGIKCCPGWKGCGLSYYNLIWNAKRCNLPYIVIFEDDCFFPDQFETLFSNIMVFLQQQCPHWDIFNGCIADLPNSSTIEVLSTFEGVQYVKVNKMLSTVFNIYHQSVYDKILQWDINTQSSDNTIDGFIKNIPDLNIITTHPFLFKCIDIQSTIWGQNLYQAYNALFLKSHNLIKAAVEQNDRTTHNTSNANTTANTATNEEHNDVIKQ